MSVYYNVKIYDRNDNVVIEEPGYALRQFYLDTGLPLIDSDAYSKNIYSLKTLETALNDIKRRLVEYEKRVANNKLLEQSLEFMKLSHKEKNNVTSQWDNDNEHYQSLLDQVDTLNYYVYFMCHYEDSYMEVTFK